MLQLSDRDIKKGKSISQDQLDKDDLQWLSEQDNRQDPKKFLEIIRK